MVKIRSGKKNKIAKCGRIEKQQYRCKNCGCNYTEHIKLKAIKYYLKGNGFRRIEKMMGVSHVFFINLAK